MSNTIPTLFVDIDGCLNSFNAKRYGTFGLRGYQELMQNSKEVIEDPYFRLHDITCSHVLGIEKENLTALEMLIDIYGIKAIVISSSWRRVYNISGMKVLFIVKGYPKIASLIVGETRRDIRGDNQTMSERALEIYTYIKENNLSEYYILEDCLGNHTFPEDRLLWKQHQYFTHVYRLREIELKATILKDIGSSTALNDIANNFNEEHYWRLQNEA